VGVGRVCARRAPSGVCPRRGVPPASTTPLPHTGAQSLSVLLFWPGGQQPSPFLGDVTGSWLQLALHVPPAWSVSVVQALPSSQLVGHAPGWPAGMPVSQVSGGLTPPSPPPPRHSPPALRFSPRR